MISIDKKLSPSWTLVQPSERTALLAAGQICLYSPPLNSCVGSHRASFSFTIKILKPQKIIVHRFLIVGISFLSRNMTGYCLCEEFLEDDISYIDCSQRRVHLSFQIFPGFSLFFMLLLKNSCIFHPRVYFFPLPMHKIFCLKFISLSAFHFPFLRDYLSLKVLYYTFFLSYTKVSVFLNLLFLLQYQH